MPAVISDEEYSTESDPCNARSSMQHQQYIRNRVRYFCQYHMSKIILNELLSGITNSGLTLSGHGTWSNNTTGRLMEVVDQYCYDCDKNFLHSQEIHLMLRVSFLSNRLSCPYFHTLYCKCDRLHREVMILLCPNILQWISTHPSNADNTLKCSSIAYIKHCAALLASHIEMQHSIPNNIMTTGLITSIIKGALHNFSNWFEKIKNKKTIQNQNDCEFGVFSIHQKFALLVRVETIWSEYDHLDPARILSCEIKQMLPRNHHPSFYYSAGKIFLDDIVAFINPLLADTRLFNTIINCNP
jgi:hypothetical protein